MTRIIQTAFISAALCMSAIAMAPPASAGIGISINLGNVADGYSDGYWDNHHQWHTWRAGEWDAYRRAHPNHAHNWRHDDRHHH